MEYFRTVSFSIIINGRHTNYFIPSRGLREGDPLSPYMFILCTEGFSKLIRKLERQGLWKGLRMGWQGPQITHLSFADYSVLFATAAEYHVQTILEVLDKYEKTSCQKVNLDKSRLYGSRNLSDVDKKYLAENLRVLLDDGKGLYLGLPYTIGRTKNEIFFLCKGQSKSEIEGLEGKIAFSGRKGNPDKISSTSNPYLHYVLLQANKDNL